MPEPNKKTSTEKRSILKKGSCRDLQNGGSVEVTGTDACVGMGLRRGRQSKMPPVEPAIDLKKTARNYELEVLKAQAKRLKKTLEIIQEQIRSLTEK